ncbi:YegP family protein [Arthrobacter sp. AZCC_0090]|uniref:YegP family protein n=1 Tax=Arthrobacter sp. AZCC_0090 TaxID=2735881 RepID=UPI00161ED59C|nr:DUF1508 domain-containing protein [Arthrobacter sp. AZCC_0090]
MAGKFELFVDAHELYRFRLKAADGTVMAVSREFETKPAAVAGIREVRACAGMGLITDLCPRQPDAPGSAGESSSPSTADTGPPSVRKSLRRTLLTRNRSFKAD